MEELDRVVGEDVAPKVGESDEVVVFQWDSIANKSKIKDNNCIQSYPFENFNATQMDHDRQSVLVEPNDIADKEGLINKGLSTLMGPNIAMDVECFILNGLSPSPRPNVVINLERTDTDGSLEISSVCIRKKWKQLTKVYVNCQ